MDFLIITAFRLMLEGGLSQPLCRGQVTSLITFNPHAGGSLYNPRGHPLPHTRNSNSRYLKPDTRYPKSGGALYDSPELLVDFLIIAAFRLMLEGDALDLVDPDPQTFFFSSLLLSSLELSDTPIYAS